MKKKEKKLLIWGAIGLGAIWLLTRPKSAPVPQRQPESTTRPTRPATYAKAPSVVSGIGLPYTFNAEV